MPRIPLFITNALRTQLRDAGYSEDDIDHMTPDEAWEHVGGLPGDPLLETALQLFDAGLAVVPIVKGQKRPSVKNWEASKLSRESLERHIKAGNGDISGIGIISGSLSGNVVVLDFDGAGWRIVYDNMLEAWPELGQSVIVQTGSGKRHIWIRCPDLPADFTNHKFKAPLLGAMIELRGNRSNNLAPPSLHPNGNNYEWISDEFDLVDVPFVKLNEWLSEWANETNEADAIVAPIPDRIPAGERNSTMTSIAGSMRRRGLEYESILAALREENKKKCHPPLSLDELEQIAKSVARYTPGAPVTQEFIEAVQGDTAYLINESVDDEGNARCLLKMFPNKFLYSDSHGWMYYNGRFWERGGAETILDRHVIRMLQLRQDAARKVDRDDIRNFCRGAAPRVRDCKKLVSSIVWCDINEFDVSKDTLNCRNGVIDLMTGTLEPHSPMQRYTYCIPVEFSENVYADEWENWLLETVNGDQAVASYIQQAIGYSLTGHTDEECMFYLYGPTRSGKGTFSQTILSMLGHPLSTEVDFTTFTAQRDGDAQNFDLAGLRVTRFVSASESNKYQSLNAKRVKAVTGGDQVRCAFKYGDLFSYSPQFKIWLSSNEMVNADVDDDAIWGRVRVITFPNSYLGKEDKALKRRMLNKANLEGVLRWAVTGAQCWYASLPVGLEAPHTIGADTQKHRGEIDFVASFLEEEMTEDQNGFVKNQVIYTLYRNWCDDNGVTPMQHKNFTRSLKRKGFDSAIRRDGGSVTRGICGLKVAL